MPTKLIIDGFTVWVGKNNKQNDYLTCKLARNQDIWFHTKDIHGCHVILQNTSKESTLDILFRMRLLLVKELSSEMERM